MSQSHRHSLKFIIKFYRNVRPGRFRHGAENAETQTEGLFVCNIYFDRLLGSRWENRCHENKFPQRNYEIRKHAVCQVPTDRPFWFFCSIFTQPFIHDLLLLCYYIHSSNIRPKGVDIFSNVRQEWS